MTTPLSRIQQIIENDSGLSEPLVWVILWAATTPDVTDSKEYEEALDFLAVKLPGFREWRDQKLKIVRAA